MEGDGYVIEVLVFRRDDTVTRSIEFKTDDDR